MRTGRTIRQLWHMRNADTINSIRPQCAVGPQELTGGSRPYLEAWHIRAFPMFNSDDTSDIVPCALSMA